MPPVYWNEWRAIWRYRAFVCRYGHQDIYRLLGRDPLKNPLTPLELAVFAHYIAHFAIAERKSSADAGLAQTEE